MRYFLMASGVSVASFWHRIHTHTGPYPYGTDESYFDASLPHVSVAAGSVTSRIAHRNQQLVTMTVLLESNLMN